MLDIKPRDVQVASIAAADTTVLRSRTWDRLKFEVEYSLQRGTTANSYLIRPLAKVVTGVKWGLKKSDR